MSLKGKLADADEWPCDLAELEVLYSSISPEERDELLQCLLVAASISGETVIRRVEECLLELAGRDLIESPPERQ